MVIKNNNIGGQRLFFYAAVNNLTKRGGGVNYKKWMDRPSPLDFFY